MSYRYTTPSYERVRPRRRPPSARSVMVGLIGVFVALTLVIILAGRLPFTPTPVAVQGSTYRQYVQTDRELLGSYGRTTEGAVHIPIDQAMNLIVERGLPVRDNPSATPGG